MQVRPRRTFPARRVARTAVYHQINTHDLSREQWRRFFDLPVVEWSLFALGVLLVIAGFLVAPIPGPGGVFLIAPGLALILKTSMWAKRHYVKFKRWQPKAGRWADWALRRRSAKRREEIAKAEQPGRSD